MSPSRRQPAALLVLVALVLQIVAGSLGGRVCVDEQDSGCASVCCDVEATACGEPAPRLLAACGRFSPAAPECCLEIASDLLAQHEEPALRLSRLQPAMLAVATLRARVTGTMARSALTRTAALPPPSTPILRATVLLL